MWQSRGREPALVVLSRPVFWPQFFASYMIDFRVNGSEDQSELVRGGDEKGVKVGKVLGDIF